MAVATKFKWPPLAVASENESIIRERAVGAIADYEARYGISSADLAGKLANGSIKETHEVCLWLLALDTLQSVGSGE